TWNPRCSTRSCAATPNACTGSRRPRRRDRERGEPMAELTFRHIDDFEPDEARAQLHGERRAAAKVRRPERGPGRTVLYTEYDPGLPLEAHGHRSDQVIFVIDGFLQVGETPCPPGTMVLLEHGATFGPLVAGPDGTTLLEFYAGNPNPVPADPEGYQ